MNVSAQCERLRRHRNQETQRQRRDRETSTYMHRYTEQRRRQQERTDTKSTEETQRKQDEQRTAAFVPNLMKAYGRLACLTSGPYSMSNSFCNSFARIAQGTVSQASDEKSNTSMTHP